MPQPVCRILWLPSALRIQSTHLIQKFFFKNFFFHADHLKSLCWIFYTTVSILCFFFFFGLEACKILVPWPEIEPVPPALEGEVLTTRPTWKSLSRP